ncbi:MAG: transposase [Pseudomonadota bacterium]
MNPQRERLVTLESVLKRIQTESQARRYYIEMRWPDGPRCLYCNDHHVYKLKGEKVFKCSGCLKRFSLRTGTIFEKSKLSIGVWIFTIAYLCEHRGQVGSTELATRLGLSQKSAWYILDKLQNAAQTKSFRKPLLSQKQHSKSRELNGDGNAPNKSNSNDGDNRTSLPSAAEPPLKAEQVLAQSGDAEEGAAVETVLMKLHKARLAFGWGHPSDASRIQTLFLPLYKERIRANALACHRWAIEHGWDKASASELRGVIRAIARGR